MQRLSSVLFLAVTLGVAMHTGRAAAQTDESPPATAESTTESSVGQFSGTVSLNQDVFFGFYPTVAGGYRLHEMIDLTFYGIIWTTSSFSFNSGGGGLWTEAGVGANFVLLDGDLNINPQVGILNGTLLSGSDRPLAFEGMVPNLTVNYGSRFVEAQLYFGYYIALRGERANDFIHYWANAGAKPFASLGRAGSIFSIGVHWEHLRLSRTVGGDPADIYKWIGPYVQFTLPHGFSLRFAGGWDVESSASPDFYKINVAMTF